MPIKFTEKKIVDHNQISLEHVALAVRRRFVEITHTKTNASKFIIMKQTAENVSTKLISHICLMLGYRGGGGGGWRSV